MSAWTHNSCHSQPNLWFISQSFTKKYIIECSSITKNRQSRMDFKYQWFHRRSRHRTVNILRFYTIFYDKIRCNLWWRRKTLGKGWQGSLGMVVHQLLCPVHTPATDLKRHALKIKKKNNKKNPKNLVLHEFNNSKWN